MANLKLFDANSMVGRWDTYVPGSFYSVSDLIKEMNRFNITEALVFHSLARDYSPRYGNEKLLEEVEGYKRLHPCWVFVPYQTKEIPEPPTMVENMLKLGIKAARLFPTKHAYSIGKWIIDDLLAVFEDHRIPLLLDFGRIHHGEKLFEWGEIAEICSRHPQLPVILVHEGLRHERSLYPLFSKFDNLHLELSYFFGHMGIEEVCENFGAKHLIYGTGMPTFAPGPSTFMLTYAEIGDKDKELIAGENLRRLLKAVR